MRRRSCRGFSHGTFYQEQPTTGAIVIDTAAKRPTSGVYGVHVTAVSGASTSLQIPSNTLPGGTPMHYWRFYLWVVTMPGTARVIVRFNSATKGTTAPEITLKPDGTLTVGQNGVVAGTSATALVTGKLYRIEYGLNLNDELQQLLIDGNTEIDWVGTPTTGLASTIDIFLGAVDTVAAAFEYYANDFAYDMEEYPGHSRIVRLGVTGIDTDNANWTIGAGAGTKNSVIAEVTPDGDTSYIVCTTTNNQSIWFTLSALPAGVITIKQVEPWAYHKRDGATSSSLSFTERNAAFIYLSSSVISAAAAYAYSSDGVVVSQGPYGPNNNRVSDISTLAIGVKNTTAQPLRVSALWAEVEYDDTAGSDNPPLPMFLADLETGNFDEFLGYILNGSSGTVTVDSTHAKFGTFAMRTNPANGSRAYHQYTTNAIWWGTASATDVFVSFWIYVAARGTGDADLFHWSSGASARRGAVLLGTDGSLSVFCSVNGAAGPTAAGILPTGEWHHIGIIARSPSAASVVTDGRIRVYLDGVRVLDTGGCNVGVITLGQSVAQRFGQGANVSGGCDFYYDGIIVDARFPHTQHQKMTTLFVNGAGGLVGSSFDTGPATGGTRWQQIDEVGAPDDDTSYVVVPTGTTDKESYTLQDSPANNQGIFGVQTTVRAERDGATNGGITHGLRVNSHFSAPGVVLTTTAAYLSKSAMYAATDRDGRWTPTKVTNSEVVLTAANASNKSRVTQAIMTLAYRDVALNPQNVAVFDQMIG